MDKYIMALDQGTTSSRTIIYDKAGNMISVVQREFTQIFPHEGWNTTRWRYGRLRWVPRRKRC